MHDANDKNQKNLVGSNEEQQDQTLSALWQAQPTTTLDLEDVKSNLLSERRKQRWYMVFDSLAFVPALYFLTIHWEKFSVVAHAMFIIMLLTALPLLVYQLWLRRVAAFYRDSQTADHLSQLTKQIKNNIKIAFITKHSTWTAVIFGYGFLLERYLFDDMTNQKIIKMVVVITSLSVGMLIWYVWAHKRQKRFEHQLNTMQRMAQ